MQKTLTQFNSIETANIAVSIDVVKDNNSNNNQENTENKKPKQKRRKEEKKNSIVKALNLGFTQLKSKIFYLDNG